MSIVETDISFIYSDMSASSKVVFSMNKSVFVTVKVLLNRINHTKASVS